jgi:hypothetical protein
MSDFTRILILTLFCMLLLDNSYIMGQESKKLELMLLNTKASINKNERSIKFFLKLFNRSNEKLKLYRFYNEWSDLCPVDWLPDYAHSGLNVGIFDKKGKMLRRQIQIVDSEADMLEIWNAGLISIDSAQAILNKRYGDEVKNWEAEERKKIVASEISLLPGDSVETNLDVEFSDYSLKKGEYEIVIYYVINKKIFEYIRESKELFVGYVKSNKIPLIVK